MALSKYQEAVIASMKRPGNKSIRAVAGSGKSYTLKRAAQEIPPGESVLVAAFNKKIADALVSQITHPRAVVKTINAFGAQICRNGIGRMSNIDPEKPVKVLRGFLDMNDPEGRNRFYRYKYSTMRLIDLFRANLIMENRNVSPELIMEYSDTYSLDVPDKDPQFFDMIKKVYGRCLEMTTQPDFRDQTFMPLYLGLPIPRYKWGLIDESQDLDPNQAELLMQACDNIVLFGDPNQAIYGFKGAMADAMERMEAELHAELLPLSICYRCPKAVVRRAKELVPEMEPCDWAPEGKEESVTLDFFDGKVKTGDFVICRNTAPLIHHCLNFIRQGRAALVEGRDIGVQLIAFIKARIPNENWPIEGLARELESYYMEQMARLTQLDRDQQKEQLTDRVETIRVLMDEAPTVKALIDRIESIFTDSAKDAIIFMTAHKSKGRECPRVWILEPELFGRKQKKEWATKQEKHLLYVAETRVVFTMVDGKITDEGALFWIQNPSKDPETAIKKRIRAESEYKMEIV